MSNVTRVEVYDINPDTGRFKWLAGSVKEQTADELYVEYDCEPGSLTRVLRSSAKWRRITKGRP